MTSTEDHNLENEVNRFYKDIAQRYEFIIDVFPTSMTFINKDHSYDVVNQKFANSVGRRKSQIIGRSVAEIWGSEVYESVIKQHLDKAFKGEEIHYKESFTFGGMNKHMEVHFFPYQNDGDISHVVVTSSDKTEEKQLMDQLEKYAYTDRITGLPNRTALEHTLQREIKVRSNDTENDRRISVLYIALDNLERVNETCTHTIGDVLLENSGLRIQQILRDNDEVYRFEGKNLIITLPDTESQEYAAGIADQIKMAVTMPYNYRGRDIAIRPYIGISTFPDDADTYTTLIQNAASAMSEAKEHDTSFRFYDKAIHQKAIERMKMESDLYFALQNNLFEMYYQPIVDTEENLVGAEALIRMNHPDRGVIYPDEFIPLAEQTGIIIPIGRWALYNIHHQLTEWSEHDIYISMNISPKQFTEETMFSNISNLFSDENNPAPHSLKIEITENEAISSYDDIYEKIKRLNEYNIDILIDDFGTGNSSLAHLKSLPADILKIDKLFLDDIEEDEEEQHYLQTMISLAHIRGKQVICEGLETQKQVTLLQQIGCDYMQGYHYSKPIPKPEFEKEFLSGPKPYTTYD